MFVSFEDSPPRQKKVDLDRSHRGFQWALRRNVWILRAPGSSSLCCPWTVFDKWCRGACCFAGQWKKQNQKQKVPLSAWRISSSTEDDTSCPGLCSYQSSSNTSSSLNLSAFVPPRCQGRKKYIQDLLGSLTCTHGLGKDRFGSSCHLRNTFIASAPGGSNAFRTQLFRWKHVMDGAAAPAQHRSVASFSRSINYTHLYICVCMWVCACCVV